jgi:hypothetical protein
MSFKVNQIVHINRNNRINRIDQINQIKIKLITLIKSSDLQQKPVISDIALSHLATHWRKPYLLELQ